jgi:hypothetical protein
MRIGISTCTSRRIMLRSRHFSLICSGSETRYSKICKPNPYHARTSTCVDRRTLQRCSATSSKTRRACDPAPERPDTLAFSLAFFCGRPLRDQLLAHGSRVRRQPVVCRIADNGGGNLPAYYPGKFGVSWGKHRCTEVERDRPYFHRHSIALAELNPRLAATLTSHSKTHHATQRRSPDNQQVPEGSSALTQGN